MKFRNSDFLFSFPILAAVLSLTSCSKEDPGYTPAGDSWVKTGICINLYDFSSDNSEKAVRIVNMEDNSEINFRAEESTNSDGEAMTSIFFRPARPDVNDMISIDPSVALSVGTAETRVCIGDYSTDLTCIYEEYAQEESVIDENTDGDDDVFYGGINFEISKIKCQGKLMETDLLTETGGTPSFDLILDDSGLTMRFRYVNWDPDFSPFSAEQPE
ncbi:MAG: hypothetical protein IAB76_04720 [Bacteroidetes bacterium]|uniref:Uncharacterized protein n=1 Tax=Candidatus Cryptobacteroides avistercoris TaxID=2840758 RepID=A0A9D9IYD5_9BACT|nr:hypothetical protein [Candidatus Cryptobacteroides avistercoris]